MFRITVAESAEKGLTQACMRNTFPLSINSFRDKSAISKERGRCPTVQTVLFGSLMLGPCFWATCLCEGVLRVEFNCRQPMEGDGT